MVIFSLNEDHHSEIKNLQAKETYSKVLT